jgi:hypothetical protein
MRRLSLLLFFAAATAVAAEPLAPFSQTLTLDQKQHLGLAGLSPGQLAALDAAVAAYTRGETTAAVQQAVKQVEQQSDQKVQQAQQKAAETAVAEYKKKQDPGVIARTLDAFKPREQAAKAPEFKSHVMGEFRGWSGGTYFPLENGQVWRQVGTEDVEMPPVQNAEVEIYQSGSGYWRLRYHGAWITVKRLQ